MAGLNPDVIKDYEMPTLCNMETAKETGFAVILTLSIKFDYTSAVFDDWRKRLEADDYMISVKRNQLLRERSDEYWQMRKEWAEAMKDEERAER